MPQIQLPMFPEGVTHITSVLAFEKRDGRVTYFNGMMPVFSHDERDVQTFRMMARRRQEKRPHHATMRNGPIFSSLPRSYNRPG